MYSSSSIAQKEVAEFKINTILQNLMQRIKI